METSCVIVLTKGSRIQHLRNYLSEVKLTRHISTLARGIQSR